VEPAQVGSASTEYVPGASPEIVYVPPELVAVLEIVFPALLTVMQTPTTPLPL
jgi:hypothetical protein